MVIILQNSWLYSLFKSIRHRTSGPITPGVQLIARGYFLIRLIEQIDCLLTLVCFGLFWFVLVYFRLVCFGLFAFRLVCSGLFCPVRFWFGEVGEVERSSECLSAVRFM